MDLQAFYKDQYDKSLASKSEINSSLSTHIGILTALVAALYYASTNFDLNDSLILSISFIVFTLLAVAFLSISTYRLIKAFSDFHNGQEYAYLNDTDYLDNYYTDLVTFYSTAPDVDRESAEELAVNEFNSYLTKELIKNTAINQINNRLKTYHRFKCHQFMIYALIVLSLLVIPFGIDFGIHKGEEKVHKVKIEYPLSLILSVEYKDSVQRLTFKTSDYGKSNRKKTDTTAIITNKRRR
ncbi:hypothetical protein OQY15_16610 [Pedobacter sp. MC2016-15]|uniref:hypothetical protein n=1 Tax=Pedobacter sp. MC2016-15 TaxID=2994473 RepID=UPI0022458F0F|nr:hypothetical protein [Pedobacter sp. MC2016-15]MCX2480730.1 hypothetical protein [Pedobacter sp. MC2016-15]